MMSCRPQVHPVIKFGTRYYDPSVGRWTQLDPSGIDEHYVYASSNPVNYVDPTGRSTCGDVSLGGLIDCASKVDGEYVQQCGVGIVTGGLTGAIGGVGTAVGGAVVGCGQNILLTAAERNTALTSRQSGYLGSFLDAVSAGINIVKYA